MKGTKLTPAQKAFLEEIRPANPAERGLWVEYFPREKSLVRSLEKKGYIRVRSENEEGYGECQLMEGLGG